MPTNFTRAGGVSPRPCRGNGNEWEGGTMVTLHKTSGPALRVAAERHLLANAETANSGRFFDRFDMVCVAWHREEGGDIVYRSWDVEPNDSRRDREDFHADG